MSKTITANAPQGIGDIFWAYQRLAPHFDVINFNIMVGDWWRVHTRAKEWLPLLPKVGTVTCKKVDGKIYNDSITRHLPLSGVIYQAELYPEKEVYYSVNWPLEQGTRLEDTDPYPVEWVCTHPIRTDGHALATILALVCVRQFDRLERGSLV